MKAHLFNISCRSVFAFTLAVLTQLGCKSSGPQASASANGWKIVRKPKQGTDGLVVAKDPKENTTVFDDYETKQTAPDGKVLQWYQGFADSDGKCLINIVRAGAGDEVPAHAGIQLITHYLYRPDGNISEKYEFFGN